MLRNPANLSRRSLLRGSSLLAAAALLEPLLSRAQSTATAATLIAAPAGSLRGTVEDGVNAFRGIPFAQPPVGPLRFRAPERLKPWSGVRDAGRFAAAAMQKAQPGARVSEDCLYLNVWAPVGKGPYPVFVWIHGGGFTGGQAFAPIFDGAGFARDGIVLVTVAYRLGVFGFMDLEPLLGSTYADSGNNAMRDLTLSLHWVHDNIAAFGGDPTQVTVGGESAGAKATAALLAIPEATALFQSAISESGGGERVLTRSQAAGVAQDFSALWKQAHAGGPDLRTAPAGALIETQEELLRGSKLHFPFRSEVGGALLRGRPVDLVAGGSSRGKRLLIGTNLDESALFLGPSPKGPVKPSDLGNMPLDSFAKAMTRYASVYPAMSLSQREIRAVTAEEYWVPSVRLADAHAGNGGDTWMYRLDFARQNGRMQGEAYHSEDLGFVWNKLDPELAQDDEAKGLAAAMQAAWISFVHGTSPAADNLPHWPQYTPTERATMILDRASRVETDPNAAELKLWTGLR